LNFSGGSTGTVAGPYLLPAADAGLAAGHRREARCAHLAAAAGSAHVLRTLGLVVVRAADVLPADHQGQDDKLCVAILTELAECGTLEDLLW
jgi:hypothetical protein